MARAHLFGGGVLLTVVVVGAFDIGGRHGDLGAPRFDIDEQVADLALLGNLEVRLVRVEIAGDVRVAGRNLAAERVGGEPDHRELDLVVAPPVLLLELRVRDRQPFGDGRPQLFDGHAAPDAVLEIGG